MPPSRKRPRAYDHDKIRAAVLAQFAAVRKVAGELTADQLARPTRLPAWNVRELLTHIATATDSVSHFLDAPEPPKEELALTGWAATSAPYAEALADRARADAREHPDLTALYAEVEARLAAGLAAHPGSRLLPARTGVMTLTDYLVTRCVELVVHGDDLRDALPEADLPFDRQALAACTRLLADTLAAKAPGGATEVRIPPYAVVQCVEGPRHTRGTPPNVVETDPVTWLRLATGRLGWDEAVAAALVAASGERADLSGLLPLMA